MVVCGMLNIIVGEHGTVPAGSGSMKDSNSLSYCLLTEIGAIGHHRTVFGNKPQVYFHGITHPTVGDIHCCRTGRALTGFGAENGFAFVTVENQRHCQVSCRGVPYSTVVIPCEVQAPFGSYCSGILCRQKTSPGDEDFWKIKLQIGNLAIYRVVYIVRHRCIERCLPVGVVFEPYPQERGERF